MNLSCTRWLQALFTRGGDSTALALFLANKPGEHGLKQAARAVDTSYSTAHNSACSALVDALHRAAFLLDELQGLLASSEAYTGLCAQVLIWPRTLPCKWPSWARCSWGDVCFTALCQSQRA
jgi:Anaphase-promoting complex, cyclosome, subunit 4